jgi:hypothetical protein
MTTEVQLPHVDGALVSDDASATVVVGCLGASSLTTNPKLNYFVPQVQPCTCLKVEDGIAGKVQSLSSTHSSFSAEWNTVAGDCECVVQRKGRRSECAAVGRHGRRPKRDAEDSGQVRNC